MFVVRLYAEQPLPDVGEAVVGAEDVQDRGIKLGVDQQSEQLGSG